MGKRSWPLSGSSAGRDIADARTGHEVDRDVAQGTNETNLPAGAICVASGLLLMATALQTWL